MGIHQELLDFDDIFDRRMSFMPVVVDTNDLLHNQNLPSSYGRQLVVNKLNDTSLKEREFINNSLYTRYRNDSSISNVPSCSCGYHAARHLKGITCEKCFTPVTNRHESDIHSILWIKTPNGIPGLMNPAVWTMLSNRFKRQNFDTLRWLTDTSYASPVLKPAAIITLEEILKSAGIERGYVNFYNHFDEIMEILFSRPNLRQQKLAHDYLYDLIKKDRKKIFSQYLPLPHKLLMVVEETNFFTYHNEEMRPAVDALWTMAGIDSELSNLKPRQKENRTVKAISLLAEYHQSANSRVYMKKEGLFRGHTYGWRSIFSFRTVISSITDPHRYNEIHVPWGVGITVFRFHLINKLDKLGWLPKDIIQLLNEHSLKYHPLLDQLFQEIIADTRDGLGYPTMGVRNPSLKRGSAQYLYITKVKTSVEDITTGISIQIVKPLNADFDGKPSILPSLKLLNCWEVCTPETISSQYQIDLPVMREGSTTTCVAPKWVSQALKAKQKPPTRRRYSLNRFERIGITA